MVNCGKLNETQTEYVRTHGRCPPDVRANRGIITPDGLVGGSCGSSWIYISNPPGHGTAKFDFGVSSTAGPIASYNWTIYWANNNTGAQGNVPWSGLAYSQTTVTGSWTSTTGAGLIDARLTGNIILTNGNVCTLLNPSDSYTVD
jgi:hypothetical protein